MISKLKKFSPKKITTDLLFTTMTSLATVIGVLFINAYISRTMGLEVLGEYSLIWRFITSLIGIFLLGMNIAVPFYMPRTQENKVVNTVFIIFQIFTIPIILILTYIISTGIVPGINKEYCIVVSIFAFGISLKTLIYSYFRGIMNMMKANLLQFISIMLIPVLAIIIFSTLKLIYLSIGISLAISSIVLFLIHRKIFPAYKIDLIEIKKIIKYGGSRIVGIFGESFLIAGIPVLLAFNIPLSQLAFFNSSLSIIRVFLIIVGPISIILLPRISKALSENDIKKVQNGIEILINLSIMLSVIMGLLLLLFGNDLLKMWLGVATTIDGMQNISLIFISIPFFIIFKILNSPINALSTKGFVSRIYVITTIILFVTYLSSSYFGFSYVDSGILSIVISYFSACSMSLFIIKKKLNIQIFKSEMLRDLIIITTFQIMLFLIVGFYINIIYMELIVQILVLIMFIIIYYTVNRSGWIKGIITVLLDNRKL